MASYVVLTTILWTEDEDGKNRRKYFRGDTVSGLSAENVERLKAADAIAPASADEAKAAKDDPAQANPAETSDGEQSAPLPTGLAQPQASEVVADVTLRHEFETKPDVERPAKTANKAAWVQYAQDSGQLTEDEAQEFTTAELRDSLK